MRVPRRRFGSASASSPERVSASAVEIGAGNVARRAQRDRHRRVQHFAERVMVVVRGPVQRRHQLGVEQRRVVENAAGGFELLGRKVRCVGELDDEADFVAAPERHEHAAARRGRSCRAVRDSRTAGRAEPEGRREGSVSSGTRGAKARGECSVVWAVPSPACGRQNGRTSVLHGGAARRASAMEGASARAGGG